MRSMLIALVFSLASAANIAAADDVLPNLVLQADPSAKDAKLKVGFDLLYGQPRTWIVSPFFQATTNNGVTDLLVLNGDGYSDSGAWELGGTVSQVSWPNGGSQNRAAAGNSEEYAVLERNAYATCRDLCNDKATEGRGAPFCELRKKYLAQLSSNVVDPDLAIALKKATDDEKAAADAEASADPNVRATAPGLRAVAKASRAAADAILDSKAVYLMSAAKDYCPAGGRLILPYLKEAYDPWSAIPSRILTVGVSAGLTTHKYLQPAGAGIFSAKDAVHTTQSLGASIVGVRPPFTLEVPIAFERKFRPASNDSAKWCESPGDVINDAGMAFPAEVCDEQPIGPLLRRYTVRAGAFFGTMDPESFWRLSVGVRAEVKFKRTDDEQNAYSVGVVVPFYIGTRLLKSDAKGLIRVSIGTFATRDAKGDDDKSMTINLAILSSPTLFPAVFDQF